MQVEGGFLDGLDLRFEQGLNVLIGGRGTGKSSIIELIRYCLNVRGYSDDEDSNKSLEQALSVLQDGQVTLEIEDGDKDIVVSRSASSDPEGLDLSTARPLIFSQKDVESVGLSVRGRLNIIDFFSSDSSSNRAEERKHSTQIQSMTTEICGLLREADQFSDRLSGAESVRAELVRAEARANEISKTSQQLDQKQKQLAALSVKSSVLTVKADALRRALDSTMEYRESIASLQMFGFPVDDWPAGAGSPDLLAKVREKLKNAESKIEEANNLLSASILEIEAAIKEVDREKAPLDEQARTIRRDVEGLKEGAGAAARQLAGLREQVTQLDALKTLRTQKLERVKRIQKQRAALLDGLETLRDERSAERQRVAHMLTDSLSPLIRVKIRQSAQLGEFIGAITNGLRGSGLRYNELSTALAAAMSPRELIQAVENQDTAFLSRTAKITAERAERIVSQLRANGAEAIITVALDDIADFELLDGSDFKPMDGLSVGQKCTVVLSILLQHPDRVLIVDQPEDHLDNAFIVDTLIGAIRNRSSVGQLLFSTHNANIPVLGEATQVIRLASNGKRGFVMHAEALDHPKSVSSITKLMEGGQEAFQTRAKFYRRYLNE